MSFLDKLKDTANQAKDKAVQAVDQHAPHIKEGIDKAGGFVDKQTKGKYSDKISKGTQQASAAVDKIKSDDAKSATGGTTPPAGDVAPPPVPPTPGPTPPQTPPPADPTPSA